MTKAIPKKLYRGVSPETGSGTGIYSMGKGLYSTFTKSSASKYGTVVEVDPEVYFPKNPLVLRPFGNPQGAFADWLLTQSKERNIRDFNRKWGDPADFVLSKGYDGVVVGDEVVRYHGWIPEEMSQEIGGYTSQAKIKKRVKRGGTKLATSRVGASLGMIRA